MDKIMLIEDDKSLRTHVAATLRQNAYEVYEVEEFQNVMEQVEEIMPDLIILDINLPYFDGNYYCHAIRKKYHMPIIITSARNEDSDQILSMELGSDDYLVKPFNILVLLSRVGACLRRTKGEYSADSGRQLHGLTLHEDSMKLAKDGEEVELSKNEYKLLKAFFDSPDTVLSRESLLETIWDDKEFVDDNTLTVNVTRIKKKLIRLGVTDKLRTIRGSGYLFEKE